MRKFSDPAGAAILQQHFWDSQTELFPLLKKLGFDAVFTGFESLEETEAFASAAKKSGLLYESLHAPWKNINEIWRGGETADQVLRKICDAIYAAGKCSVPFVVAHLSSGDDAPVVSDVGKQYLEKMVDCAIQNKVVLCFENQRKIANIALAFEMFDKCNNVGFCWDIGHEACLSGGWEYMELFGDKLAYTHIHDNFSVHNGDLHRIPFDGNIDFRKKMEHLKKRGFKGSLNLEVRPGSDREFYGDISAKEYYKKAYEAASRLREYLK